MYKQLLLQLYKFNIIFLKEKNYLQQQDLFANFQK